MAYVKPCKLQPEQLYSTLRTNRINTVPLITHAYFELALEWFSLNFLGQVNRGFCHPEPGVEVNSPPIERPQKQDEEV